MTVIDEDGDKEVLVYEDRQDSQWAEVPCRTLRVCVIYHDNLDRAGDVSVTTALFGEMLIPWAARWPDAVDASIWKVEPESMCVVHTPSGLRVRLERDADEPAMNGNPDFCPPELLVRASKDGGRELAQLMREAGEAYHPYLRKQRH